MLIPLFFFHVKDCSDRVDVQPKEVLSAEVTKEKLVSLQVLVPTTHTLLFSDGFIIPIYSSRILFDRGRETEIIKGFSDLPGNYKSCSIPNSPGFLVPNVCSVLVDKFDQKSIYANVFKHGYQLGWFVEDSMVILWVKNENRYVAGNMFDKTPESVVWWLNSGGDDFLLQYKMGRVFDPGREFESIDGYSYSAGEDRKLLVKMSCRDCKMSEF
ncbi:uncharacterized protein LOC113326337 isoform X2 [Papaver somniferum]|uniref:uncharacterized protein LOC113326337 isoform X2 n=1 Tax=Papaver somniferum TaxID=3469 RepID=UPI000E6FDA88|nr:uncharacterized protein LOC113326337 isoform X2 [Papaver somniferum]